MVAVARPFATQFPVLFRLPGARAVAGSLTVTAQGLALDGGAATGREHRDLTFDELLEVRIVRGPTDRLNGHVSLALEVDDEPPVLVAPLGYGLLHEIADLVAAFAS